MKLALAGLVGQVPVGPDLWLMTLRLPHADEAQPGQFVHLAVGPDRLRRPFSILAAREGEIDLLYRVKGHGTRQMAGWAAGREVDVLGPLGRAFTPPAAGERILLVGGGIGVAPLAFYGRRYPGQVAACMGFRTAAEVCGIADLQANGVAVGIHTEDGTMGIRGRVDLDLANRLTHVDRVLTCGPWRMMATVARLARAAGVPCEAALEREMGCGIGACLGCVVEATDGQYLRVCVEGPVVSAEQVAWEA